MFKRFSGFALVAALLFAAVPARAGQILVGWRAGDSNSAAGTMDEGSTYSDFIEMTESTTFQHDWNPDKSDGQWGGSSGRITVEMNVDADEGTVDGNLGNDAFGGAFGADQEIAAIEVQAGVSWNGTATSSVTSGIIVRWIGPGGAELDSYVDTHGGVTATALTTDDYSAVTFYNPDPSHYLRCEVQLQAWMQSMENDSGAGPFEDWCWGMVTAYMQ